MQTITSIEEALEMIGLELGVSAWRVVDQKNIDAFAELTEDCQWIHVDVQRAVAESPYGGTIAHGFLTLSLVPRLSKDNYRVQNARMGLNYGLNRVRFLSPVRAGARIRVRSQMVDADRVDDRTVNLTVRHTVEIDGATRPALVADLITRWTF